MGVAPHGEGVGGVARVCEGEEREEGAGQAGQGDPEREKVSLKTNAFLKENVKGIWQYKIIQGVNLGAK